MAAGAVVVAGCGRRHGRTGQGPYADMVADAVPKMEQAVGVPFKTPPRLEVRTREQVRDFLLKKFDEETPAAELAGEEAAYKAFGFIPDTLDLRRFLVQLLTEQIVGYYDPGTKALYIVQDAPEDLASVTVTHELVHALQDQYVNLDSIQRATGDNDRQMAAQAVIEGEATYEQMSVMTGGGNVATLMPGGWDRVREMIRETQGSQPVFGSAPEVIQEELLFPYLSGAEFIRMFKTHYPESSRSPTCRCPPRRSSIRRRSSPIRWTRRRRSRCPGPPAPRSTTTTSASSTPGCSCTATRATRRWPRTPPRVGRRSLPRPQGAGGHGAGVGHRVAHHHARSRVRQRGWARPAEAVPAPPTPAVASNGRRTYRGRRATCRSRR